MKAIETSFDGRRFRSRTEARWAVFLKELGLSYEYEPEGVVLGGTPYLPDFRVPALQCWIEVKGLEPTDAERRKCEMLARESGMSCLLSVGMPRPEPHIIAFLPEEIPSFGERLEFTEKPAGSIALGVRDDYASEMARIPAAWDWGGPPPKGFVAAAMTAAMGARFEFGETGEYHPGPVHPRWSLRGLSPSRDSRLGPSKRRW